VAYIAAGENLPVGVLSTKVLALTQRVMKTMFIVKLKRATAVILLLAFGLGIASVALSSQFVGQPDQPSDPTAAEFQGIADLSGVWHDDEWGTVKLTSAKKGVFEGIISIMQIFCFLYEGEDASPVTSFREGREERRLVWVECLEV
jgi:hypothetical protein